MINAMLEQLRESSAPEEQYARLGLDPDCVYDAKRVIRDRAARPSFDSFPITAEYNWSPDARNIFIGMLSLMGEDRIEEYFTALRRVMAETKSTTVTRAHFEQLARQFYSNNDGKIFYFLNKLSRIR